MSRELSDNQKKMLETFKKDTNNFSDISRVTAVPMWVYMVHPDESGRDCEYSMRVAKPSEEFMERVHKSNLLSILDTMQRPEGYIPDKFEAEPCPSCGFTETVLAAISGDMLSGKDPGDIVAPEISILSNINKVFIEFSQLIELPFNKTRNRKILALGAAMHRWAYLGKYPECTVAEKTLTEIAMRKYLLMSRNHKE